MSRRGGDGIGSGKKIPGPRPIRTRDRDEDLMLFREMYKREKDRTVSLLQPVSDEFEATGYGMAPTGKKGNDNLGETAGKNDYDWLKTPPATPLFPSLEMETNGPELIIQREIPIAQPLSRFAGNLEAENGIIQSTKSHSLRPKVIPPRYSTPSGRPSVSLPEKKNVKSAPVLNPKMNQSYNDLNLDQNPKNASSKLKPVDSKESSLNLLAANLSKSMGIGLDSNTKATKPKSRGVSPLVRSKLPAQIAELSNETPPNLRTDRSTSAYRTRSTASQNEEVSNETPRSVRTDRSNSSYRTGSSASQQNSSLSQKRPESVNKTRRQASSPGSTRGRKQDSDGNLGAQNDRTRTQVLGSRMVDKLMNARISGNEERHSKIKLNASMNEGSSPRKSSIGERKNNTKFNTSMNESSGFGRLMSRTSLDMALRHMKLQDLERDAGISHNKHGSSTTTTTTGRRASSVSKRA